MNDRFIVFFADTPFFNHPKPCILTEMIFGKCIFVTFVISEYFCNIHKYIIFLFSILY